MTGHLALVEDDVLPRVDAGRDDAGVEMDAGVPDGGVPVDTFVASGCACDALGGAWATWLVLAWVVRRRR